MGEPLDLKVFSEEEGKKFLEQNPDCLRLENSIMRLDESLMPRDVFLPEEYVGVISGNNGIES